MFSFFRNEKLRSRLSQIFGLDTRSLAAARIALGLLIVLDVYGRVIDFNTFYTEAGVLPRAKVLELYHRTEYVSLFLASGASWWTGVCFAIEALAGACFMLGYRTRTSLWIAWFMMLGCHARFSPVLQAGDLLLRLLLFWSFFLPMGARFSLDSMKKRVTHGKDATVVGLATFAVLFQVSAVYIWTGLLKNGREWLDGTAVYYALRLDYFAKQPLTDMLLAQETLMEYMTHFTLYFELYGPFILLVPFFFGIVRSVVVLAFMGLHVGFFFFLEIGLFPWISIASWVFLLPGWFWDKCGWRLPGAENDVHRLIYGDWFRSASSRLGYGVRFVLLNGPILLFLWIVFQWNMTTLVGAGPTPITGPISIDAKGWKVTGIQRTIALTLRLDQKWSMFAPYPIKDGGWYAMPGVLISGDEVDLWQGGEPKWATEEEKSSWTKILPKKGQEDEVRYRLTREHPEDVSGMYTNQRWRKYMRRIWQKKHKALRLPYGQYMCRTWNAEHSGKDKLKTFKIVYMKDPTPKPGKSTEVEPYVIWSHNCFKSNSAKTAASKSPKKAVTHPSSKTKTVRKPRLQTSKQE